MTGKAHPHEVTLTGGCFRILYRLTSVEHLDMHQCMRRTPIIWSQHARTMKPTTRQQDMHALKVVPAPARRTHSIEATKTRYIFQRSKKESTTMSELKRVCVATSVCHFCVCHGPIHLPAHISPIRHQRLRASLGEATRHE